MNLVAPTNKAPSDKGVFTRQSSGLVRELGLPSAIAIALASTVVVSTFINFYAGLAGFTQADMIVPLVLAALIWIVAMFAYSYLVNAIPRAGGEYVYLSRIITPAVGAIAGLSLAVVLLYYLAGSANYVANYLPFTLLALGSAFNSPAITDSASQITSTSAIAVIGALNLLIVGALSMFPLRQVARIIMAVVIVSFASYFSVVVLLVTHSHGDFEAALAQFSNHPNAYNDIMAAAATDKIPLGISWTTALLVIPFMFLNYAGVLWNYYVAGELRRPGRTYIWASVATIAILAAVWLASWTIMLNTVGRDFMQAQAQLGATDASAYGAITSLPSTTNGLGYGLVLSGDPITKILIGIAIPAGSIGVQLVYMVIATRILFALAFDGLLPIGLAKLDRRGVPMNGLLVVLVGAIGFTVLNAYGTITTVVSNLSLFVALTVLAGSIAAFALPIRRPDLMMKPGATDVARFAGIPVASLWGAASAILAFTMIAMIIGNQSVFGTFTVVSVGALLIVFATGPILYLVVRQVKMRRSSIDIRLAMRELPPE
jgi:amino acid transporter